VLLTIWTRQSD